MHYICLRIWVINNQSYLLNASFAVSVQFHLKENKRTEAYFHQFIRIVLNYYKHNDI